jgi:hypothetical protein
MNDELSRLLDVVKPAAIEGLYRYADERAPLVPLAFVEALGRALGEISFDEAIAAIDKQQQELAR